MTVGSRGLKTHINAIATAMKSHPRVGPRFRCRMPDDMQGCGCKGVNAVVEGRILT